jgi:hypothetical protein
MTTRAVIAGSRLDLLDALEWPETEHPDLVRAFVLRERSQVSAVPRWG